MSKFKIGDRVKVIKSSFMEDKTIGATGTIVAIDENDIILVKLDKDIGSYRRCWHHNYTSDKMDLFNTKDEDIAHLNINKMKGLYLGISLANAFGCVSSTYSGNLALLFVNLSLFLFFMGQYYKYRDE